MGCLMVHDLIRLREPASLRTNAPIPAWVEPALQRAPWVVVRRGHVENESVPVGVRGPTRSQRFAAFAHLGDIAGILSPEYLAPSTYHLLPARRDTIPALAALERVVPILARRGYHWGPGGSVGFEIATGIPTATVDSDLDLILRQPRGPGPGDAFELLSELAEVTTPVRVDVILETPTGGVSLVELSAAPMRILVRTPDGPRLLVDPWMEGVP
jgi:phosphoribosyl-dephospho-CoA transferase